MRHYLGVNFILFYYYIHCSYFKNKVAENFKPRVEFNKRFGVLVECKPALKKKVNGRTLTHCSFEYTSEKQMTSFLNELWLSILNQEEPFLMSEPQSLLKAFSTDPDKRRQ